MGKHNDFGQLGEQLAADLLVKKGYQIRFRNFRYQKAEIDIIAQQGPVLAIVEVKSRSSDHLQHITETVSQKKMRMLVQAADHYVTEHLLEVEVRFDLITVLKKGKGFSLEHIENAFYHF